MQNQLCLIYWKSSSQQTYCLYSKILVVSDFTFITEPLSNYFSGHKKNPSKKYWWAYL